MEKETIDEIIFRTQNQRNRLMLELMARGGMRIGEVLNLRPSDIEGGRIIIQSPKSGRQTEVAFIPQKLAHRLSEYIRQKGSKPNERIFFISYPAARMVVKKAGELVGINLKPHDLRRHAATYASRSGMPIEIVSKVVLRHSNLATTQRYLGKVTDLEAMRWIENLHGCDSEAGVALLCPRPASQGMKKSENGLVVHRLFDPIRIGMESGEVLLLTRD